MKRDRLREAAHWQRVAARRGFDWPAKDPRLWRKLQEEIRELRAAVGNRRRVAEELGDLLFMVVNISRHLGVDPSRALSGANRKFLRRYRYILKQAHRLPPRNHPRHLECMEVLWQEAKRREPAVERVRLRIRARG